MDEQRIKEEVWETVKRLNRVWTEGDANGLDEYFHRDMVAICPTDRLRLEGQKACVAGWKGFTDSARVLHWKELEPRIDLYGGGRFAVVTYYFDMAFETGGRTVQMGGRDMFSLVEEDGRWWAVADQFSPYP